VQRLLVAQWAAREGRFQHHVRLVEQGVHRDDRVRMWRSQANEDGRRVSEFERDALIERHCESFGTRLDQVALAIGRSYTSVRLGYYPMAQRGFLWRRFLPHNGLICFALWETNDARQQEA